MITKEYDIVIVGSGAGGGTLASRLIELAQQGVRIAVLESGPHYEKESLTQREIEMVGLFKNAGAWPTADGSITVSMGNALGGSTLMYTGVTFRLPDDVVKDWNVEGLTAEDLKPRFDRLEQEIHVIEPDDSMTNDNNRLFKEGCDKLGFTTERIPINVKNCEQMGFCNLGCAKGNKQGTLEVQLPTAREAGIDLIPNCTVETIHDKTINATVSAAPKGTKPGPWEAGNYHIKAKRVVLAAGTAGTPAILMRSGFQQALPDIGKYITLHPALVVYGIYPKRISNYKGFPKVWYSDEFTDTHDHYIETAFYYPFITSKNLGLWGEELTYVMDRYNQLMCSIILVHDEAKESNQLRLDKNGESKLHYTVDDKTIDALCHAQQQVSKIFMAAGCEELIMPSAQKRLFNKNDLNGTSLESFISAKHTLLNKIPIASAHLQGGCRMGSVTDEWGQVKGYDWLYVSDGSLFPKSSHVNPYLTIMALADRVSEKLIESSSQWL